MATLGNNVWLIYSCFMCVLSSLITATAVHSLPVPLVVGITTKGINMPFLTISLPANLLMSVVF